jgi:hypothetical protein
VVCSNVSGEPLANGELQAAPSSPRSEGGSRFAGAAARTAGRALQETAALVAPVPATDVTFHERRGSADGGAHQAPHRDARDAGCPRRRMPETPDARDDRGAYGKSHTGRGGIRCARGFRLYQEPVLAMLVQGSAGASAPPAWSSSMEMLSGVRMKAMRPSRGGRLIVTPRAMKALQVS